MIGLMQRVSCASVTVDQATIGKIDVGLLVLVGVEREDTDETAVRLIERLINYRVFCDENDKMNLSLKTINGGLLLVPQFTLTADTRKGTRPGFSNGAAPEKAESLFLHCVEYAKKAHHNVETGKFAADMKVSLINDGPVTFTLQT